MKTTLTILVLLPLLANAQLSNSSIGVTIGLQQHINKINSSNPLNIKSHTGTTGILGALEWTIPVTQRFSVSPFVSYHSQSTRYNERLVYEDVGVSASSFEKHRFEVASVGMDLNYEIKNGICLKTGIQYSSFLNTGGSSGATASSWKNSNVSLSSNADFSYLNSRAQMFRAKLGAFKKIIINKKEKFNIGIDLILPFQSLATVRSGRIIEIDGNMINQQHQYIVRTTSTTFYCKYNFINFQKDKTKSKGNY